MTWHITVTCDHPSCNMVYHDKARNNPPESVHTSKPSSLQALQDITHKLDDKGWKFNSTTRTWNCRRHG